jgi:hypothetical protein
LLVKRDGMQFQDEADLAMPLFDKWRMRSTKKHKENGYEHARADAEDVEFPAISRIGGSYIFGWPPPLRAKCVQDH